MKRILPFLAIVFLCTSFKVAFDGDYPWEEWTETEYQLARTADDFPGLTEEDRAIYFYTNLARINPHLFAVTYAKWYIDSVGKPNNFTKSLISKLKIMKPVGVLKPDSALIRLSSERGIACARYGWMDHGEVKKRAKSVSYRFGIFGENYAYGFYSGLDVTMGWLIDAYIDSLGHREAMLNPVYTHVGATLSYYETKGPVGIMEFGGDYKGE